MNYKKKIVFPAQEMFKGAAGKLVLSKDWRATSIGEIKNWPATLASFVRFCIDSEAPACIWWGEQYTLVYNEAFEKLLGVAFTPALGKSGRDIPELWSTFGESLQAVREKAKAKLETKKVNFEFSDAGERELSFHHTPIVEPSGSIGGVFTLVSEVKKSKRKENIVLEMGEQRYVRMIEEVQDYAIILLDKDGTILNWNKGAQNIKGYRDEEIIGHNFSVFYLDEDRERNLPEQLMRLAAKDGRAMHEGWRKRKDGSKFWGSIVITALHDRKNDIIGFTKVTRDLTERKIAEDKTRQHAAELEIKNRQLEQFAYIASHDLQEPLRKIQTFIQVLEKKLGDPEARQKYFAKINHSARRMGELIQAVLYYSRLSQNEEQFSPVDLNVVLENVKADYELQIDEKKAVIKSDVLPVITGVAHELSQLFANLISNALKFSTTEPKIIISCRLLQPGEIQKITSSLDRSKRYVELKFQDNGIGFEQQYAEKIFTIFQRLNSREEYSGTGIGLALCKRIVDHHLGHIEAFSESGKGASFCVYLPLE
ncbi:MAG TPA: PAS domain S-box protein [Chryseolinea sp.]